MADFLATHPLPDDSPLVCDLLDKAVMFIEDKEPYWKLYFDGTSSTHTIAGSSIPHVKVSVCLIFVSLEGGILWYSLALSDPRTNNEAEYKILVAGLDIAIQMGIQRLHVYGDSQLSISQVKGEFEVQKFELARYQKPVQQLMLQIPNVQFQRIRRSLNSKADALTKLPKELAEPNLGEIQVTVRNKRILAPTFPEEESNQSPLVKEAMITETLLIEKENDWRQSFTDYFRYGKTPEEKSAIRQLQVRAMRYAFVNDTLY